MPEALTAERIQEQLCTEIQTLLCLKSGSVNSETHLPSLGIDSLRFVSLLLVIEQKFGVNLMKAGLKPDDTKSVRNLAAAILARRSA